MALHSQNKATVKLRKWLLLLLVSSALMIIAWQLPTEGGSSQQYRVMFYNVENLFDTVDDPDKRDGDFTPEGARHWTPRRLKKKLLDIYKVIFAVGEWSPPAIVGLCEVENLHVLQRLVYETPLSRFDYGIIHYESPDRRGIDVAMIYRKSDFTVLHAEAVAVTNPEDSTFKTRDILYVKGLLGDLEMVHLFINHWPSRFGGYMATKPLRNRAAAVLKNKTDSLFAINPNISIVIMGDFNDNPEDESVYEVLGAVKPTANPEPGTLYNLMLLEQPGWKYGTLKFREHWDTFDHIIVSGGLLDSEAAITIPPEGAVIFHADFLLQPDERYMGIQLFRTYVGFSYQGGFSDHLPVYVDLLLSPN